MPKMIEIAAEAEQNRIRRALPVGIFPLDGPAPEGSSSPEELLTELTELVRNLRIVPLEPVILHSRSVQSQYYVGSGKAQEIVQIAQESEADAIVFDTPLTPSQQRNWEKLSHLAILDREEIILEIFAERAITREAVLQVELAKMRYSLPRLTRAWSHFSRQQGGGATTRGEGEAQLEMDRRALRRRIHHLEEELAVVRKQRLTQRKSRRRGALVTGAIVGYTNVGKSSLLNRLAGSQALVRDQLFATLDPTTRRVTLPDKSELLLTDTVGFVRNLPHTLVEAFKSTLEEAVLADFVILVLDAASPQLETQWETTIHVLSELGADEKKMVVVFNKCDLLDPETDRMTLARCRTLFPDAVFCSTVTGQGIRELADQLAAFAGEEQRSMHILLPPQRSDLAALAHRAGRVFEEQYQENGALDLWFSIGPEFRHHFQEFAI